MNNTAYFFVVGAWSITTLVPMFGDMSVALLNNPAQLLSPTHNSFTRSVIDLYSWDRFITLGVAANICAIVWLAFFAFPPAFARSRTA
jgi:hypothetical protein